MAKPETVERKWYILDAAGIPLGRTAAEAARLLRGKHKTEFTPHVDTGDFIIIINAKDAVLTGRKLEQKFYRTHSGYVGGLKETKYKDLMEKRPEFAMHLAIKGMLPKNNLSRHSLERLRIFAGSEHPHAAQKPEVWTIAGGAE
jgi:large subunit ribosomal protein L13